MARTSATNKNDVADIGVKCGGELKELVSIYIEFFGWGELS